jgi:cytochrome c biogenesis protein
MMAGLLVSLIVRRRRVWARIIRTDQPGTVKVELGGLARTDNSGWGDEFERLTTRLLADADSAETAAPQAREKKADHS